MNQLKMHWRVVLVRPRNPLNIGAAARALANFGFGELVVVAPFEPTWEEARSSAMRGDKVIATARAVPTLAEALADTTLAIGTTAGSGRNLGRALLPLPQVGSWLRRRRPRGRVALVFGSEKTGLSNEDMSRCQALVRIPTSTDCPSMNLGQAVAVCGYELARAGIVPVAEPTVTSHPSDPANQQSLEHLLDRAARLLDVAGYLQPKSRAAMLLKLRRLLLDLDLTCNDARILGGVMAQMEWKLQMEASENG